MLPDIRDRADIEILVQDFYKALLEDDLIGYIFTDVAQLNLEEHLPIICDFWESVLFSNGVYRRNVMHKHIELHQQEPLLAIHFDRWLQIWEEKIRHHYAGDKAEDAIKRSKLMAELMKHKIKASEHPGNIL